MNKRSTNWKKYTVEFLTFFLGITLAFALDNWNDNRNERESEKKILVEIKNGLQLDLSDVKGNIGGHKNGIKACDYFRNLLDNKEVAKDSLRMYNSALLRDFISIQNKSGYESLKSNGLKLIENDSLRFKIITLYDFYYEILEKVEENYSEMQFYRNYYQPITNMLAENLVFDIHGRLIDITQPINLSSIERNKFLSHLMNIEKNRQFVLYQYLEIETAITELIDDIDKELN